MTDPVPAERRSPRPTPRSTPRLTLVRAGARGLERHGSLYLLSALLVLAGGYTTLYANGKPISVALDRVLGTQLAYAAALVMVLAFLHRTRRETRDPLLLAAIASACLLDALLVQHLYGWTSRDGLVASCVGAGVSLLLLGGMAWALRLAPWSRPIVSIACAILFARFAPFLLLGSATEELAPNHVALGWLLAACALPGILLPDLRAHDSLPSRALDLFGTLIPIGAAVTHFIPAGASFDLPLRLAYFAPALIIAPLLIERLVPDHDQRPNLARLAGGLPCVGLALSATRLTPGMLDAEWAQSWPLTPFTLALALTVIVQSIRAFRRRDIVLAHCAAALALAGTLGGDLPAILANAVYPTSVQPCLLAVAAWVFIACTRRLVAGSAIHCIVAFVTAGWLSPLGIPWMIAWISLIAWGPLVIGALSRDRDPIPARLRLGLAAIAMLPPMILLLIEPDSMPTLVFAAVGCAIGATLAWMRRDRIMTLTTAGTSVLGVVGWPLAFQVHGEIGTGMLLIEAGFAVLLLAFLNSLMGDRLRGLFARVAGGT